jgi:hypothetical protein
MQLLQLGHCPTLPRQHTEITWFSASGSQPQAHSDLWLDYWITTSITAWSDAVSPINALLPT